MMPFFFVFHKVLLNKRKLHRLLEFEMPTPCFPVSFPFYHFALIFCFSSYFPMLPSCPFCLFSCCYVLTFPFISLHLSCQFLPSASSLHFPELLGFSKSKGLWTFMMLFCETGRISGCLSQRLTFI